MKDKPDLVAIVCLATLAFIVAVKGCEPEPECPDGVCPLIDTSKPVGASITPLVDPPPELRQGNYAGGSCAHASTVTLLNWAGLPKWAAWWKRHYRGGESESGMMQKLDDSGLRYAATRSGDVEFLRWASDTRRGARIFYFDNHAVNLVQFSDNVVVLLDNNRTNRYVCIPSDEFVRNWRGKYGGFAWAFVYDPPPILP